MAVTCSIPRPEPQVLFDKIRDMFSANVLGGAQVIPESNEWYVVANDYAMQEQFYAIADQMWKETNPETACCENLYAMAARNGVYPKPAGYSQGYAKLTGTPGAALPSTIEISTSAGTYVSTGTVPLTLDATGAATIRIRALTAGATGNSNGSVTQGTLVTTAPGIDNLVTICGGMLCGGSEAETCEAFRQRYLKRLQYKPRATSAWIQEKLLEFPCATRVCTREGSCCKCTPECGDCGCKGCGDKLQFYVLFDDSFPCGIPPQSVVDDIQKWFFGEHQGYGEGQVEVGVCGQIYAPKPLYVNIIIDIADCITIAQKEQIIADIEDLFSTICPSQNLTTKQIELIIANIIGANINAGVRFEMVNCDRTCGYLTACGIEVECDYLPCINEVTFTPGPETGGGTC